MRGVLLTMTILCLVPRPSLTQETPSPTPVVIEAGPASECLMATARGDMGRALAECGKAVEQGHRDPRILDALASAELQEGDPGRAAKLWRQLIEEHGWQWRWAQGLEKALWRDERPDEAERVLRDAVKRDPSPAPYRALVEFLLGFSRWQDAADIATEALRRYPDDCGLHEDLGVAEAGLEHDGKAAASIRKALALGCPALRWTRRGEIPHRIDRPEYRPLLQPAQIARGLSRLSEGDALSRLRLLQLVPDPTVAPDLGEAALHNPSPAVKLASLHLLQEIGKSAIPEWRQILSAPDLMLRKHALRMIARTDEPFFVPILEERLKKEKAPHNLSLVRIALARRIAASDPSRARTLLEAVPQDDPSHYLAAQLLEQLSGGEPPAEPSPQPAD